MKIKLNKRNVESVLPADKEIVCWDTKIAGFGCRVSPTGRRTYFFRYRVGGGAGGRIRKPSIGRHGNVTADEARSIAKDWALLVAGGGDPAADRERVRTSPTVTDIACRYLDEHARPKKKPSSVKSDNDNLRLHILPSLGHIKIAELNRNDVAKFHSGMSEKPGAANRCLSLLSKMANLAEAWGERAQYSNPCAHIIRYRENRIERFLTLQEIERLGEVLDACEADGSVHISAIHCVRLLALTGCRRGEMLGLHWHDVDLEGQSLSLRDSKTGPRRVPMSEAACEAFRQIQRLPNNPHVLPGTRPGGPFVGIGKAWARIRKRAGMDDVRLHDLRHTFASTGAAMGFGLPVIGKVLGHMSTATTQRYTHLSDDPVKIAADNIGDAIGRSLTRKPIA